MASLPTLFGRYRLIQNLGSGDSVFLAVAPGPGGECVVRRPPSDRRNDSEFLSRFRRAAHLSRRLAHDGLVAVHDVGEVDGEPYLAEEFFESHDLAEMSKRCVTETRRISVISALHVACAISRALGFLHEFEGLGLVHRKLQPARVLLGYQGGVKLLDLASGCAVTADGAPGPAFLAEELSYLAPEQLGNGPVDRRADIYALGWFSGRPWLDVPFLSNIEGGQAGLTRATHEQLIDRIRGHRAPSPSLFNPEVKAELDAVVMQAVAKAPEQRFATAGEFERALLPMASEAGRDAVARLLNRLFDANREREQRAALLAAAAGQASARGRAEPTGLSLLESSVVGVRDLRAPGPGPSPAPVTASPSAGGTPAASSLSRTTVVSRNAQWLRRFFLIFGVALLVAIAFNIYMTRRLDAEAKAGKAQEPLVSGLTLAPGPARLPQASPVSVASSASAATTARGPSSGEPPLYVHPEAPSRRERRRPLSGPPGQRPRSRLPWSRHQNLRLALPPSCQLRRRDHAPAGKARRLSPMPTPHLNATISRARSLGRAAVAAGEGGAHGILGAAYFKVGRFEDAVREYGEALRLEPGNPALARRVEIARRAASRRAEGASP